MPIAPGFRVVLVLAVLFAGCTRIPVAIGPRIAVPLMANASVASSSPIEQVAYVAPAPTREDLVVELVDQRPDWEKEFRSPAVKPSQYEHAIGFVALENLDPPGELDRIVQRVAERSGVAAARAQVELRSFRVVVDDVTALRHDHSILKRVGGGGAWGFLPTFGFNTRAASDPIDPGPLGDAMAQQSGGFRPVLVREGQMFLFGPPSKLPTQLYRAGVTCEIDATVTFIGPRGSERKVLAQVRKHTPPEDETATATSNDLARTVAEAYRDVETRLVTRLAMER